MKPACFIREAEVSDAGSLATLMVELGYATTEGEMRERLKKILPDARFKTFVAHVDDHVCGMIGMIAHASYEHNDPGGRIIALVVSNEMRRRGVGQQLIRAAEKDFLSRKVTRIAVNTQLTRKEAHRFYEMLGYEKNGWRFVKDLSARSDQL